jgi:hypothetical protein
LGAPAIASATRPDDPMATDPARSPGLEEVLVRGGESLAEELRGAVIHELAPWSEVDLNLIAFVHHAGLGLDDRPQHPHPPELELRKPSPSYMLSSCGSARR